MTLGKSMTDDKQEKLHFNIFDCKRFMDLYVINTLEIALPICVIQFALLGKYGNRSRVINLDGNDLGSIFKRFKWLSNQDH